MDDNNGPSDIFDRDRRRHFRDRAFQRSQGQDFVGHIMAEEILDRLSLVKREFKTCLLIGQAAHSLRPALDTLGINSFCAEAGYRSNHTQGGVQCDEDRLPFADGSFDLIINIGTLDSVNDLPGALALMRRILIPDGLFLAGFMGAESLTMLKANLMMAEGDRIASHIHPQIDIRTAGDLMSRTGFALPVIDSDTLRLRYGEFDKLISDLRDIGSGNVLKAQIQPISRNIYNEAKNQFKAHATPDGKTTEIIELIYLCGWAPHPDQPAPARRGSGQMSLKDALNKPE
ncbi:MAG: class I SAM-dependent methyltransferase [Parasphingorhabdus sp.]|uniref:class I SAM-dependent methyltransferase n=1 Tax=Parasphingorhabdus sp. TaxID=2709688 RepID=UPI00329786EA